MSVFEWKDVIVTKRKTAFNFGNRKPTAKFHIMIRYDKYTLITPFIITNFVCSLASRRPMKFQLYPFFEELCELGMQRVELIKGTKRRIRINNGLGGGVNITENNIRILIIPTIKEDTIKIDKELSFKRRKESIN